MLGRATGSLLEGIGGDRGKIAEIQISTQPRVDSLLATYQSRDDSRNVLNRYQCDEKGDRNDPRDSESPALVV